MITCRADNPTGGTILMELGQVSQPELAVPDCASNRSYAGLVVQPLVGPVILPAVFQGKVLLQKTPRSDSKDWTESKFRIHTKKLGVSVS